jgi:polyhydroxyalkanoate synthesis regulator phasin
MNNKNLLYGFGIGILGCSMYSLMKEKLHPLAVKIVGGAINAGSTTKSFMEEVNEKAMDRRQERFKRVAENFEQKSSKHNDEMCKNIETLKKQLNELKDKVK